MIGSVIWVISVFLSMLFFGIDVGVRRCPTRPAAAAEAEAVGRVKKGAEASVQSVAQRGESDAAEPSSEHCVKSMALPHFSQV
jgi:hypothetical protein